MAKQTTAEEVFSRFIEDFRDEQEGIKYDQAIAELGVKGLKSLVIDFSDLYNYDLELANETLREPDKMLDIFGKAVSSKLRLKDPLYAETQKDIHVRFRNLPTDTPLRKIGSDYISKLVMVNGIIVRASVVTPLVVKAVFRCSACSELNYVEQSGEILKTPQKCEHCDNKKSFDLVPKLSVFMDSQRVTIQERPEDLPPGQLPRSLHIDLRDDLVDVARPGDRITIIGSIDLLQRYGRGGPLRIYDMVMEANNIDVSGRELELMELDEEDERKILEIASDPWVHRRLLQSIAPSIYGQDSIKESVMYLLFGGVGKDLPDLRIRGDINVLLVGDPGTGKSQLLGFAAKIAPRGLLTTGRGSTAAGLTAAVVKEGGTGNFILEAGALVLADKGVCCIDEIDKMREEDRGAIHPAMEQQIVSIAKGGIVATLNARASILAAGNPTLGRYNPYQTIAQNINLPVTILSRFDLIFVLKDVPDQSRDAEMAEHILGLHRTAGQAIVSAIEPQLFRKYISYAKRVKPIMSDEVIERFRDFYVKMRSASTEGGEASAVAITARQLESLVRLAEARARCHLRTEVTKEDAEAVITLTQSSLEQVGIDITTGQLDIDILYTGKPRSMQTQLQKVLGAIADMEKTGPVKDDDLYEALAKDHGVNRSDAAKLISTLMRDGTIYSPRPGYYRRAS